MILLLCGIGLVVLGAVGLFSIGSSGIAILVVGLFFVMVGADSVARDPSMPMVGGCRSKVEEQKRRSSEERDRESGARD